MTVLFVSHSEDLHVDAVSQALTKKGENWFRINLDQFPRDYEIHQYIDQNQAVSELCFLPDGKRLLLSDVKATWIRKPAPYAFLDQEMGLQELEFAKQEVEQVIFGLLYSNNSFFFNHPLVMRGAAWKCEQLIRATKLGFKVPATLTTNIPDNVLSFKGSLQDPIIFKSLSTPLLAADQVSEEQRVNQGLPTTVVTAEMMEGIDTVRNLPCHFQQYIHKQFELRVTVINERVFAAKIDSQSDERTMVDSRNMQAEIEYSAYMLPNEIEQACRAFIKSYGLNYGAIDLIVTNDNDYVFLENNPNGQFLFIEQLVPEFQLSSYIADALIQGVTHD